MGAVHWTIDSGVSVAFRRLSRLTIVLMTSIHFLTKIGIYLISITETGASRPAMTKPANLEEMMHIASQLSAGFRFRTR